MTGKKKEVKKETEAEKELKKVLGLQWVTRTRLEAYNANQYLFRDICHNQPKSDITRYLGWDDPAKIPYYPMPGEGYKGATSGSDYNIELMIPGEQKIEYDFREAYTNIARRYALPSNTFLNHVKYDREKIEQRFAEYPKKLPYANMSTFAFLDVEISAIAKEDTYTKWGSHFQNYTEAMYQARMHVTEIELKLIYDYYDIKELIIHDSFVFRCRKNLLADYFNRIDLLKDNELTQQYYKAMRNKAVGLIGKTKLQTIDEKAFKYPFYNRAFSAMVYGVFRDVIARYEQKYVYSPYVLLKIKTDGLYFLKEVPEFEKLHQLGIVKKKVSLITEEDRAEALNRPI